MNSGIADIDWKKEVRTAADGIRKRVFHYTINNNGGYLSQACSSAEILSTLYLRIMNLGPSTAPEVPLPFPGVPSINNKNYFRGGAYNGPQTPEYDRFYLSPAHYALVLYATLIETGRMAEEGLAQFNKDGSTVEMIGAEHSPGFDMMGGSLAQTLSQAAGIGLAKKLKKEDKRIWVFMSDGEMQEGQIWEAVQVMSHYKLDNIAVYIDINGQQCDGSTKDVMNIEPLTKRLEAFGGRVFSINGHDPDSLVNPAIKRPDGRPLFVLCNTDPCHGISLLEKRRPKLHYVRFLDKSELETYKKYYENWNRR